MAIMKAKSTTYEFDLPEMAKMLAAALEVRPSAVSVEYVIQEVGADPMDRFPGHKQVTGVRVTVNELK